MVCNGRPDCPNGYDEAGCHRKHTCPGFLKCKRGNTCVHLSEIGDGFYNCVGSHEDEMVCPDEPCPEACSCNGVVVSCTNKCFQEIPLLPASLKVLYMSRNDVKSQSFTVKQYGLYVLDMTDNQLTFLGMDTFGAGGNLWDLQLSENSISHVVGRVFSRCSNLRTLDLSHNPLLVLSTDILAGLNHLKILKVNHTELKKITPEFQYQVPRIQTISLFNNALVDFFDLRIKFADTEWLPQSKVEILQVDPGVFVHCFLHRVLRKTHEYCRTTLFSQEAQPVVWSVSALGIITNLMCIAWLRLCNKASLLRIILVQLCLSNMTSSAHLLGLAIVNLHASDVFFLYNWASSYTCVILRLGSLHSVLQNHLLVPLIMLEKLIGIKSVSVRSNSLTRYGTVVFEISGLLDRNDHCFGLAILSHGLSYAFAVISISCVIITWGLFVLINKQVFSMKKSVQGQVSGAITLKEVLLNAIPFVVNNSLVFVLYTSIGLSSTLRNDHTILVAISLSLCSALNSFCHSFISRQFVEAITKCF